MVLTCSCGKQWSLKDELARPGRKIRCKNCGGAIVVPGGEKKAKADSSSLEQEVEDLKKKLADTRKALEMKDQELTFLGDESKRNQEKLEKELEKARAGGGGGGADVTEIKKKLADAVRKNAKLEMAAQEQEDWKTKHTEIASKLDEAKNRINDLEAGGGGGSSDVEERLRKELNESDSKVAALEADLVEAKNSAYSGEKARDELAESDAKVAQLEAQLREATAEAEQFKEKVTELENRPAGEGGGGGSDEPLPRDVTTLQQKLTEAREKFKNAAIERGKRIAKLEDDLSKALDDVDKTKADKVKELGEKNRVIEQLQSGQAPTEDLALKSENDDLKGEIEDLKQLVDRERKRAAEAGLSSEDASQLHNEIGELKEQLEIYRTRAQQITEAKEFAQQAKYIAGDLHRNIESIAASLAGVMSRAERLNQPIDNMVIQAEELTKDLPQVGPSRHLDAEDVAPAQFEEIEGTPAQGVAPVEEEPVQEEEWVEQPLADSVPMEAPVEEEPVESSDGEDFQELPAEGGEMEMPAPPVMETEHTLLGFGGSAIPEDIPMETQSGDVEEEPAEEPLEEPQEPVEAEPPKKKGFFGRLFKKK